MPLTYDRNLVNMLHIEALYEFAAAEQFEEVKEVRAHFKRIFGFFIFNLQVRKNEALAIPKDLNYNSESLSLSMEEREKLLSIQPQTVRYCLN